MKKVAVLWSSPNLDGLTASAKEQFIRGLEEAGAQVEEIHLNTKKLDHCRSRSNLAGMRKFYLTYKDREPQIVQSGIGQLGMMQENGIVQSPIGQLTVESVKRCCRIV